MKKDYMNKFPCDWTRDDWRDYLKDMIEKNRSYASEEYDPEQEIFYIGKVQACKDVFSIMFPGEDWED